MHQVLGLGRSLGRRAGPPRRRGGSARRGGRGRALPPPRPPGPALRPAPSARCRGGGRPRAGGSRADARAPPGRARPRPGSAGLVRPRSVPAGRPQPETRPPAARGAPRPVRLGVPPGGQPRHGGARPRAASRLPGPAGGEGEDRPRADVLRGRAHRRDRGAAPARAPRTCARCDTGPSRACGPASPGAPRERVHSADRRRRPPRLVDRRSRERAAAPRGRAPAVVWKLLVARGGAARAGRGDRAARARGSPAPGRAPGGRREAAAGGPDDPGVPREPRARASSAPWDPRTTWCCPGSSPTSAASPGSTSSRAWTTARRSGSRTSPSTPPRARCSTRRPPTCCEPGRLTSLGFGSWRSAPRARGSLGEYTFDHRPWPGW